jgi:hypothetical protein
MIRTARTAPTAKSLIVSTVPALFYRANGFYETAGSTDAYIMLFDSTTVPVNGTTPVKSYVAQANFEFNEHISDGIPCLVGIVLVLSTTKDTLTIITGGDTGDIQCEYEESRTLAKIPVTANANTGAGSFLQVWADGGTPGKLVDVTWTNNSGTVAWLMAFAAGAPPANGSVPDWQSPTSIANGTSATYQFGKQGRDVFQKDTAQVYHNGCILVVSTTANLLTIDVGGTDVISTDYITTP